MTVILDKKKIHQVFRNVRQHQLIEQMIRQFSSNKDDIRIAALKRADLTSCRKVLEPGCAFGAFTEALKGRLHPDAHIDGLDIVPEYEPFFLDACNRAGYSGSFSPSGVYMIKNYPAATFDLIICSFALYFFSDIIPEVARVLKKDGIFITITHGSCNMQELIAVTRTILKKNKLLTDNELLPIEIILRQFSAENGSMLLSPHFHRIEHIDFNNSLIFPVQDIDALMEYYRFKRPFFLTGTKVSKKDILDQLLPELKNSATADETITMCKDDRIFICSQPAAAEELYEKKT
jgi:ubiquinone/menaquinone biosynthesis C-methylase UbiE